MNAATVERLIRKSGQTCSVVSFTGGATDRYDNPTTVEGSEQAGVPCLLVTDPSTRLGDFITQDTQGQRDRYLLYLPGDVEVGDDDTIEAINQAKYGGAAIEDGPLTVTRVDRSLLPLVLTVRLKGVR